MKSYNFTLRRLLVIFGSERICTVKNTFRLILVSSLLFAILGKAGCISESASTVCFANEAVGGNRFKPTWESLAKHESPEWFRDAKLGIYTHWGPVTVGSEDGPGGGQWYGCNMYKPNSPTFEYHRKRFGDQHQFGYKDIVPLFKAEKFDAAHL